MTNTERWPKASTKGVANSILVKVNQIGTLSETLDAVSMAQRAGYTAVMSHRSGETEEFNDRRSRGCDELRTDQDGLAVALGPAREVQPTHPHRRRVGGRRSLCGTFDSEARLGITPSGNQPNGGFFTLQAN